MAFTVTKGQQTVMGNQRVWQGVITADAATGVVSFGMTNIYAVAATPASAASSVWNVQKNALAAGTASAGDVSITGCTSGDDFELVVWGA